MKFIGIDAGKKTGCAVWCSDKQQFDVIKTTTFWDLFYDIGPVVVSNPACFVIEDPTLNKPTFFRNTNHKGMQRISRNVGANAREATLLIERFESMGLTVLRVRPQDSKKNAKAFQQITGYTGRCSQHARDAAMLVFHMTETKMKLRLAA